MGVIELGLRCPQSVNGIAADPEPDWTFDKLVTELNSVDQNLKMLDFPSPLTTEPRNSKASKDKRGFIMHVSADESDYADSDNDVEVGDSLVVCGSGKSDDSEDTIALGIQFHQLMDKVGLGEGADHELTYELWLGVMEEVRSNFSFFETWLANENEKLASLTTKMDKYRELQLERDKKFDLQYQRTIAEALDNHLIAVRRDHEHVSQLEERRIRDDMAREEARRRESAFEEEKMRQERIRAEEEAKLKAEMAERAKAAAIEAKKKAAEEASAKRASENLKNVQNTEKDSNESLGHSSSTIDVQNGIQLSVRNIIKASENALELEKRRRKIYEELFTKDNGLKGSANQDYEKHGMTMFRQVKSISATTENIRTKAEVLTMMINNPEYPQSTSIKLFAEKIITCCENRSSKAIFATSRVIVLVTSQIPVAMDILLAELNRICIYTVPKHIIYSREAFGTTDDYYKAVGYEEKNGKIESNDDFLGRLNCYMKLYGALVQTEVGGFRNLHGIAEAWAWLARFLNTLPATLLTATALYSFLEMAGYALYRRYKNQFEKLLNIIDRDFLNTLQGGTEASDARVTMSIRNYIETKQYKREPEGLQLITNLESKDFAPEGDVIESTSVAGIN